MSKKCANCGCKRMDNIVLKDMFRTFKEDNVVIEVTTFGSLPDVIGIVLRVDENHITIGHTLNDDVMDYDVIMLENITDIQIFDILGSKTNDCCDDPLLVECEYRGYVGYEVLNDDHVHIAKEGVQSIIDDESTGKLTDILYPAQDMDADHITIPITLAIDIHSILMTADNTTSVLAGERSLWKRILYSLSQH